MEPDSKSDGFLNSFNGRRLKPGPGHTANRSPETNSSPFRRADVALGRAYVATNHALDVAPDVALDRAYVDTDPVNVAPNPSNGALDRSYVAPDRADAALDPCHVALDRVNENHPVNPSGARPRAAPPVKKIAAKQPSLSSILAIMNDDSKYSASEVGQRIARLRNVMGLTQTDFAERAGVPRESVSLWERGKQRPGIGPAQRIADVYNVTLDWLFLGRQSTLQHQMALKLTEPEE